MKKIILSFIVVLATQITFAADQDQTSVFSRDQKLDAEGVELYSTNLEMKSYKRIGAGIATGGLTGLIGLNIEMNLEPANAVTVGLGRGDSYNSFNLGWKHNIEAEYLSLYTKVGYAKWFNSASGSGSADKSDILARVLTDDEIKNNRFGADFIAGGAGLEYNQLEGELSGVNFFGELLIMAEVKRSIFLPTGSIGITYFY